MELTKRHYFALAAMRVSLGMLMVWWGLHRVLTPEKGMGIQKKFYAELFPSVDLQYAFGYLQLTVGLLVVLGLFRKVAVPAQLIICGFSSIMILPALLDPFGLWLPMDRLSPIQHFFYPSVIAMAAGVFLFTARNYDKYCLDRLLFRQPAVVKEMATAV